MNVAEKLLSDAGVDLNDVNDAPVPSCAAVEASAVTSASSSTPFFGRGEILDNNYRILDGLAAGGMGEVYRAVHLRLPRMLAIKTLQPEFAARQEWVARFCREACVLAQLRHPNIVQVLDFNVAHNGVPYIAMELIEGQDLRAELDRGRRFDALEVVSIVRQVASALDAAHAAGVVHRDLKPENVLLTPAPGQPPVIKVIDFGLSQSEGGERVTGDHAIFGTPDYMAPEQAQGLREQIDARTDQFALAALSYTLLTGRRPYERETPVATLYAIVHEGPAPMDAVEGWNSSPVERVLRRGMARENVDRFPSVLAFADALESALVEGEALPRPTAPVALRVVPRAESVPTMELAAPPRLLRRRVPAVLVSLLLAGALWGGLGAGRARGARGESPSATWRANIGAVQDSMSKGWHRVRGAFGEPSEWRDR